MICIPWDEVYHWVVLSAMRNSNNKTLVATEYTNSKAKPTHVPTCHSSRLRDVSSQNLPVSSQTGPKPASTCYLGPHQDGHSGLKRLIFHYSTGFPDDFTFHGGGYIPDPGALQVPFVAASKSFNRVAWSAVGSVI